MNSLCLSRLGVLRHVIWRATVITTHTRNTTENSLINKPVTNSRNVDLPSNVIILGVDKESTTKICSSPSVPIPAPDELEVIRKAKRCHRQPVRVSVGAFEVDFTPTSAVELHPEVFCSNPRIDFLYLCKEWQSKYREVDYSWKPTRAEMGRGRKKPWPQKGSGRARHGSRVAPQWKGGGVAHGPRGPTPLFQKILPQVRLKALTSALSIKFFQQDLCVVNSICTSSPEPDQLKEILINKGIGSSALLVYCEADDVEENSNISTAVEDLAGVNLMPLVGLNVWSLLHHDKLVLTVKSLDELETKVLWNMNRYDWISKPHNFYRDLPFSMRRSPFAKIMNTD